MSRVIAALIVAAAACLLSFPSQAQAAYATSGTWGTCKWSIDSDGVLTIGAGTSSTLKADTSKGSPWKGNTNIKQIHAYANVTIRGDWQDLFAGCTNLEIANLSGVNATNATYLGGMFSGDSKLHALIFGAKMYSGGIKGEANGDDIELPTPPENKSYTGKWSDSIGGTSVSTEEITNMYSHFQSSDHPTSVRMFEWESRPYTIHFDGNGSDHGSMSDMSVPIDSTRTLDKNSFRRSMYVFKGWSTDATAATAEYNDVATIKNIAGAGEEITLYAVWEHVPDSGTWGTCKWSITDSDSGKVLTIGGGTTPEDLDAVSPWHENVEITKVVVTETVTVKGSITQLFAGCSNLVSVNISGMDMTGQKLLGGMFEGDGKLSSITVGAGYYSFGSSGSSDDTNVSKFPVPVADGTYTGKWLDTTTMRSMTQSDIVSLYAYGSSSTSRPEASRSFVWETTPYTIHLDANGGTGTMSDVAASSNANTKTRLPSNTFMHTGYTFMGWARTASDKEAEFTDGKQVSDLAAMGGQITLYAVWSQNVYTIHFAANGGTGDAMPDKMFMYGDRTVLSECTFTRFGYTFGGWLRTADTGDEYLTEDVTQIPLSELKTSKNEITLKAKWVPNPYAIHLDANGGTGSMVDVASAQDDTTALPDCTFTKSGYHFMGWSVISTATKPIWADGQSVKNLTNNESITLYAIWSSSVYNVSFLKEDGTTVIQRMSEGYGEKVKCPAGPANTRNSHFTFVGWTRKADGKTYTSSAVALMPVTNNETYTAAYRCFNVSYSSSNSGNVQCERLWVAASGDYLELGSADYMSGTNGAPGTVGSGWAAYGYTNGESGDYKEITFPVWSVAGGQDDLTWYDANPGSWTRGGETFGNFYRGMTNNDSQGNAWYCGYFVGIPGGISAHGGHDSLLFVETYRRDCNHYSGFLNATNEVTYLLYLQIHMHYDALGGDMTGHALNDDKDCGSHYVVDGAPKKTGYLFKAWSPDTNENQCYAAGQIVGCEDWNVVNDSWHELNWNNQLYRYVTMTGNNVNMHAVWAPARYSVNYYGNGATSGTTASSSHIYDIVSPLTDNGYSRTNTLSYDSQGGTSCADAASDWDFDGWSDTASGSVSYGDDALVSNLTTTDSATLSMYAQWSPNSVTLPTSTMKGHQLMGWYTSPTDDTTLIGHPGDRVVVSKDMKLYAHWTRNDPVFNVTYYADYDYDHAVYNDLKISGSTNYEINPAAITAATKPGCTSLTGWFLDKALTVPYVAGPLTNNLTLYAANMVTLTYKNADGTFDDSDGYRDSTSDGATKLFPNDDESRSDNGGEGILPVRNTVRYGTRLTLQSPSHTRVFEMGGGGEGRWTSLSFDHWSMSSDGNGSETKTLMMQGDATVYGVWKASGYDGVKED